MTECKHRYDEMDSATADGMCPLCLADQNKRLRATVLSLLEMPAACIKDSEVIENVERRKKAMDEIGVHRVVQQSKEGSR